MLGRRIVAHTARITLEIGGFEHTVLIEVAQRHAAAVNVVAARHRGLVFLPESGVLGHIVDPALVPGRFRIGAYLARRGIHQIVPTVILEGVVVGAQRTAQTRRRVGAGRSVGIARGEIGRIVERLPVQLDEFALIDQIVVGNGARRNAERGLEVHLHVAFTAALGVDDDDAVGSACTVQRTGRSVLEHGDRLDVIGVDGADRTRIGDTVHDVERRRAGADRTETANGHGSLRSGLAAARRGLHAGHLSVESLRDVGYHALLEILRLDDGGRSGEGLLLGRAVSDDEHLVDGLRIFGKSDFNRGPAVHGNRLRLIPDKRNLQRAVGGNRQGEPAARSGRRADGGAFDHHGRSDDGTARLVYYRTGELPTLGHRKEHSPAQHGN